MLPLTKKPKILKMINKGDKITVLDDDINGIVTDIKGDAVYISTDDGFDLQFDKSEVIKIGNDLNKMINLHIDKQVIEEKKEPIKRNFIKQKKEEVKEVSFDLHIEKLTRSTKGMQPFDMLELQIETAQRHIDFAIKNRIPKIVLIHGVGDGKLRAEIEYTLKRYENIWFQEANYQRYGQGAIEINFKQNARRAF